MQGKDISFLDLDCDGISSVFIFLNWSTSEAKGLPDEPITEEERTDISAPVISRENPIVFAVADASPAVVAISTEVQAKIIRLESWDNFLRRIGVVINQMVLC